MIDWKLWVYSITIYSPWLTVTICSYMTYFLAMFIFTCFKLYMETWKQYASVRSRAIFSYLMLNQLFFWLNVLINDSGQSALWFWSFSHESQCHQSHCKAGWWVYSRLLQLDGTWAIVKKFIEEVIWHPVQANEFLLRLEFVCLSINWA